MTPLRPARARELAAAPYTYAEVGATRGDLPAGYRHVRVSRVVEVPFVAAAELLMTWQVPRRAGLAVAASSPRAEAGAVTEMRWLGLRIPCRVVYVVAEPDRVGFAYGTLPGHPERGEEAFFVERGEGDSVRFGITAFSRPATPLARPATPLARAGAPVARRVQDLMTERYLRALG